MQEETFPELSREEFKYWEAEANDVFNEARELLKDGCFIEAREGFALSHAIYSYLGRGEMTGLCRRFLTRIYSDFGFNFETSVQDWINEHHGKFDFALALANTDIIKKTLDGNL